MATIHDLIKSVETREGGTDIGGGATLYREGDRYNYGGGLYDPVAAIWGGRATEYPGTPNNLKGLTSPPGTIPAQPLSGRKTPPYYVPFNQYNPVQTSPVKTIKDLKKNQEQIYKQLLGTSTNIRNRALVDMLDRYNTPMEQLFTGALQDQLSEQRAGAVEQLGNDAAARGLYNTGVYDKGRRAIDQAYIEGSQTARQQGINQDFERKKSVLAEMLGLAESDLRFYEAARSGQLMANSLFSNPTKTWSNLGLGGGQGIMSIASAGMGGGGMGMGGMSSFGGGGLQSMNLGSGSWTGQDAFGTKFGGAY